MSDVRFEAKPRWPGGPRQCVAANLPAFQSEAALHEWRAKNAPSCILKAVWQCTICGEWHHWSVAPDPTGTSSGTGRSQKSVIPEIKGRR